MKIITFIFAFIFFSHTAFAKEIVIDEPSYGTIPQIKKQVKKEYLSLPILMYHHIDNTPSKFAIGTTITPDQFINDIEKILAYNFTTITYTDLLNYSNGVANLPEKPIIITFDDGYKSNYDYAFPELKKRNMKAVISIIGEHMEGNAINSIEKLSWDNLREMYESGVFEIQSHSYALHKKGDERGVFIREQFSSSQSYAQMLIEDFYIMQRLIKEKIGTDIFVLTYPYGKYSNVSNDVYMSIGVKFLVTIGNEHNIILENRNVPTLLKRYNSTLIDTALNNH